MTSEQNIKCPIKVSLKQMESFLRYVKDSGYIVEKKDDGNGFVSYYSNAPGYGQLTPLADVVEAAGRRRKAWLYIRLPKYRLSMFP